MIQALTISRIYFLQIRSWCLWFFLYTLLFPIGLVFFIRAVGSSIDLSRLAAGAIVLSISSIAINATGYWIMMDRFEKRIELIRSMPVSSLNYYLSIIFVSVAQAVINVHVLLLILIICGFTLRYSFLFLPIVVLITVAFSFAGILIGNKVKDTSHGSLIMNLLSTGAVLICPIFYSATIIPKGLSLLAKLMPHTIAFNIFSILL